MQTQNHNFQPQLEGEKFRLSKELTLHTFDRLILIQWPFFG